MSIMSDCHIVLLSRDGYKTIGYTWHNVFCSLNSKEIQLTLLQEIYFTNQIQNPFV